MNEHEHHWEYSWAPLVVVLGIVFLVPLAFTAYFQYHSPLLCAVFAGLGAPMLLAGAAKWTTEGLDDTKIHFGYAVPGISVFIISEVMIFLSFFTSYWFMRLTSESWPPAGTPHFEFTIPIIMTVILVTSSFTAHFAEEKLEEGDVAGMRGMLMLTILLGTVFFGLTCFEYSNLLAEGFGPSTNTYSTAFYSITGFHASHVLVGIVVFCFVLIPAFSGRTNKTFLQVISVYWHMVDIVWFFVVSQLYFW